jgi:serine/threonine protein kinase/curli biogenesis system outer membrane secretion channel CsgG
MVAEVLCCPAAEELAAFRLGRLSSEGVENLAGHLEQCSECRARLEAMEAEADALVEALRRPPESEPFSDEPGCRFALARVLSLGEPATDLPDGGLFPGRVGSYRLIRPLGRGAMGCVYEALHTRLKRLVAVKLLSGRRGTDLPSLARFQREMEAIGKLDHPNIIRATDAGEVDGVPFLVMEFVDGPDLARVVKACGSLSAADACEVIRQAALGLQHAYEHGLVHRDLKPSNLLLGQGGVVKVLDLGLALFQGEHSPEEGLTATGQLLGTFDYMAPEQAEDTHTVDVRADLYSLGCTLYHFLTGRPPFAGEGQRSFRSKMRAHAETPPPPIDRPESPLPAGLEALVAQLMAKDPTDRPATPAALAEALAPFAAGSDLVGLLARTRLSAPTEAMQAAIGTADQSVGVAPSTCPGDEEKPLPTVRKPGMGRRVVVWGAAALLLAVVGAALAAPFFRAKQAVPTALPLAVEASAPPEEARRDEEKAPAVYPLAVLTFQERGDGAKDYGPKVADLLFAKLAAKEGVYMVERNDLKKVLDELELGLSGAVKPGEEARVGRLTGAKLLLTGSIIQVDRKLTLVARLIGTETGRIAAASVEGKTSDELGPMVDKLADAVADKLKDADKLVARPAPAVDRLAALKQKMKKGARPVVWVSVSERHVGRPAVDPAAQTELIAFLKGTGFEVIDAEEGGQGKADLLIKGEAFSETAGRTGNIVTAKARVEIKVVDRKTDKVVAVDRQVAVAADLAEQSAGKAALQEAAAAVAERVLPKLVKE